MERNREINSSFGSRVIFPLFLPLVLLVSVLFGEMPALAAPSKVTLDAERVSYDDEAGKASAEGNAVLTYEGATIRADRIDYDVFSQKVRASPPPGGLVTLEAMGRRVTGNTLEYDLDTQEGVLSKVGSDVPIGSGTLHISGGGMRIMPYDLALEQGLVRGDAGGASYVGFAEDVSVTTCDVPDHPHYRLETKSITVIPGRQVVAKTPRLYLGNTFIFSYPMDYIVNIDRKALKHNIMPYVQRDEKKGAGAGMSGALEWENGVFELGAAYWDKTGFEWMAGVEQSIGGGFSIKGGVEYSWQDAWEDKQYSPRVGLYYARNGWEATLRAAWREYMEIQKDANYEYRGRLDRKPEFTVLTPWIRDRTLNMSWFRLGAEVGSYWERTPLTTNDTVTRYGLTLRNYLESPMGAVTFFSDITFGAWFYDKDSSDQEIADGFWGFRYSLGNVEMASGYERRFVWGESPMLWDEGRERERFHQRIRFPVGKDWFLAVRGSYDMDVSMIDEVNYSLQWVSDCMKLELRYHDDRTSGSNSAIGLSLSLLAYPDTPVSFGERRNRDPFDPPVLP
ncbi:MAG: hypothetical protein FWG71_05280 [Synergistaceae bacterium]|nr:hypothetical protein [Synergistaceae bacterium]